MKAKDGGLRQKFREHFPLWQWTTVETGIVSPGTPDAEFCAPGGTSGWVEFKKTDGWKITFEPLQPAWIHKRARLGGRVFVAVVRKKTELFVLHGVEIARLVEEGVKGRQPINRIGRSWDWAEVEKILRGP
ncbi:MAG: hypothetical protein KGL39_54045 [Patescibacteria group bacterium]|nr:hypothetical protein [Patescibacteria group bacterium]